ncbi:ABC transporter substrate-binding protein [Paenibacillaceae bacterium]|nr:ABC transporter substrate-binding protein [Paenibacillaceae bacterium]
MLADQRRKYLIVLVGVLALSLLLSACGSTKNDGSTVNETVNETPAANTNEDAKPAENAADNETPADSGAAAERTLTDPLGHEVIVPANPQRILAGYLEDHLLTLGVKPIGQWSVKDSPMKYLQGELEGIPNIPHDLPYEVAVGFEPDLILIGDESLLTNDKYESYAKIAPTYALGNEINSDWRKALLQIGEVLDKKEVAEQALSAYNEQAEAAKAQLKATSETAPSAAAIWLVAKTFWIVSDDESSGAVLYEDLGLTVPEIVKQISQGDGGIWKSISMEKLAELDADHIFLVNSDTATGAEALNDPIWKTIKAVKNGNVHEYGPESSWLYTGTIANKQIIEDVLESMIP